MNRDQAMAKKIMEKIYSSTPLEKIPWHSESPPAYLKTFFEDHLSQPDKILELGCGTGNYIMYLASKGFTSVGADFSESALKIARDLSQKKKLSCTFVQEDVTEDITSLKDQFDFIYDWELLHHIYPKNRVRYIKNVKKLLNPGGIYLSVCFSEKSRAFGGQGKYRDTPLGTRLYFSSEEELNDLFSKYFKIVEIKTIDIPGKQRPHKAISAHLQNPIT